MRITTLPVYSKLAEELELPVPVRRQLPSGWRLSQHQLETYNALTSGEYDVVINTALTGDGRSLAAQLHTLVDTRSLLIMVPTGELVRDQEVQMAQTLAVWQRQGVIGATTLTGERLRQIAVGGRSGAQAATFKSLAAHNDMLLTDPELLHDVMRFLSTGDSDAPSAHAGRLLDLVDLLAFDEFHAFDGPQIVSVLNALLLIRELTGQARPKRFLFLAPTPGGLLEETLQKAGFRVKSIAPAAMGLYLHTRDHPDETRWRPILGGAELHFWANRAEDWVDAHLDDTLLAFFRDHAPGAKGAILVNDAATAHRLAARLLPVFAGEGLSVLARTGLTGAGVQRAAGEADLLIVAATAELGVDFRPDFLVFESGDAGAFLHRLGRHRDDGRGQDDSQPFAAHALVPDFVAERLFTGQGAEPAPFAEGGQYTRERLSEVIHQVYPPPCDFSSYARKWGWIQTAHVYSQLFHPKVQTAYTEVRQRLQARYLHTFGLSTAQALSDYEQLREEARQIVEEAQSFGASTPLRCGVIDDAGVLGGAGTGSDGATNDGGGSDRVKRVDLLALAANADLEWLGAEAFAGAARRLGEWPLPFDVHRLAGWFRLAAPAPARRPLTVRLNEHVGAWSAGEVGEVQVLIGVTLDVPGVDWLKDLNRHLRRRKFVALLCLAPPPEIVYRLQLPPLLQVHPFIDRDGLTGSIAFGREALVLNVAIRERGFGCGANGGSVASSLPL